MTTATQSVCIHAVRESLACKGLTELNPYSLDIIIACGVFVGLIVLLSIVWGIIWYAGLGRYRRTSKSNSKRLSDIQGLSRRVAREQYRDGLHNDRYRNMTQSEIDRYKRR